MIKRLHTVTGDPYTKVSLLRSKVSYVIGFFYRILQVISSTSRNWFPGNFYRMMEWDNFADSGENFLEAFKISANSINLFLPSSFNPLIMLYGFLQRRIHIYLRYQVTGKVSGKHVKLVLVHWSPIWRLLL